MKIIGLIPAAGQAKRLSPLPCSKEIFPIGGFINEIDGAQKFQPKPIAQYLIDQMTAAGARNILMVINRDKCDILRYFGSGANLQANIAYLVQEKSKGMPDALNLAREWTEEAIVLFGMPDTIFTPGDAFQQLLRQHLSTQADLTLGLFPTLHPEKFGMVAFDPELHLVYTVDKPEKTDLEFMWGMACWQPKFTQYINEYLTHTPATHEIVLSEVMQSAIVAGMDIRVFPFKEGQYIDIGSPEELEQTIYRFSNPIRS
jgi:glucose-1-phosphate thymidylyltransferase